MATADIVSKKIVKPKDQKASELEESVAKTLVELEVTTKDLAADLRDLYIVAAKVKACSLMRCADVASARRKSRRQARRQSPSSFLSSCERSSKRFRGMRGFLFVTRAHCFLYSSRLIRELEKKFSGRHVVFLAQRTILSKAVSARSCVLRCVVSFVVRCC